MNWKNSVFLLVMKRLWGQKTAVLALAVLLCYLGTAIWTECYTAHCKRTGQEPVCNVRSDTEKNLAPSRTHWLGTDYLGRDVLLRSVFAIRTAVKVGLIASLIAVFFGVGLGIISGYFGGTTDDMISWAHSTFAAIPSLLFILAFSLLVTKGFLPEGIQKGFESAASFLGTEPGMFAVYLGIGLTSWISLCRVVRAETMRLRGTGYVLAAKALGEPSITILRKHILPNVMHVVIVYFTMIFAQAVMSEVIVSYLGLGVQFEPSWGLMIAQGQERLWRGIWWEAGSATLFLFILVLALNFLGDALRDALDPRIVR
ncbi:MAG: ABC transporter permease [Lentisphaeria bacterium]|nr:ABC transporter permease [Lentisphaeria bacterium]MBQ7404715.1 ABC transporter permease [Lentisphaeria bacterium]